MIVPGFEPGTSALSEQHSNQAELRAHLINQKIGYL